MNFDKEINKLIEKKNIERDKYIKKLFSIIGTILLITVGLEIIFTIQNIDADVIISSAIIGGSAFLIVLLISSNLYSRKLKGLFAETMMEVYNNETNSDTIVEIKPKISRDFNLSMGLFVRGASVITDYKITLNTSTSNKIDILNCRLVTSNGKSSTIHFYGFYAIYKFKSDDLFQIRSKYKPKLKGIKFKQLMRYPEKVFIPELEVREYVEEKYIQAYRKIANKINTKALYLASNEEEVHLAITPRERFKIPKVISRESFLDKYKGFIETIKTIETTFAELSDI